MTVESQHFNSQALGDPALDAIRLKFLEDGDALPVLAGRSRWVDHLVSSAFERLLASEFPEGAAALAVGGYGRAELFPHSDVDVLLLLADAQPTGRKKEALSRFLQEIWDAGLRLSHSVRTVKDCCEVHSQNVELNVSLLDQRFLTGDQKLYDELAAKLPRFLQSNRQGLARHLCRLTRERHAKFHATIYHLEPNIKDTPGGLRDLHLVRWLALLDDGAKELPDDLHAAARFLFAVRCFLHYESGRDNNLLNFDTQESVTEQDFLPFQDPSHSMREYYRNARAILRASLRAMDKVESRNNSLLANFRDWRSRLSNADFTVSRERILFKAPQALDNDPELAMRLFQFQARHRVNLHPDAERRLAEYLPLLQAQYAAPGEIWPHLRVLLDLPYASFALRNMHDTGVLTALFPEWELIDCYVVRDFHHRYTVDEHTLITIENLERLADADDRGRQRFADLLSELESTAVLKLALLFHDVGKGQDGPGHCVESRMLAEKAAERIGMGSADREMLAFLIENHLVLSGAMTLRDLDDPETAVWLAHQLGTIERLRLLTLMTLCDVGAVNPTALSPWRLEQLWRVYTITYRELTRELEDERIEEPVTAIPAAMPGLDEFLRGFPTRYLRIHKQAEIERHFELEMRRPTDGARAEIQKIEGIYHLTVVAKDRLYLFASVAGALASFGMNILKAEAFANGRGTILDSFAFEDPQRTLELNPPELDRLRQTIERVVTGRVDVKNLLKNRPKPVPPSKGSRIHPRITFDNEVSSTATLVEVVTEDRPGLLYGLTSAFSEAGCNIDVVLVDTEAHRALDVFYVTSGGAKLDEQAIERLRTPLLRACTE